MLFSSHLVVVRGGGDLGTGAVVRLQRAGFPVVVLELEAPLAIRRRVAVGTAVLEGKLVIGETIARRVADPVEAETASAAGDVAVLVNADLPEFGRPPSVIVDARMAKRNLGTAMEQAPLTVGLGPGFTAGRDCHAVVETMRGHNLGRVIWEGSAAVDTGIPGEVGGKTAERVVRAPMDGVAEWVVDIGDIVASGDTLGVVAGKAISAPIEGVVRGLIAPGSAVATGMKIADVDPRGNRAACFEVSDKALAIGGGVVEAVLTWLNRVGG